jgi:hypothetical protein
VLSDGRQSYFKFRWRGPNSDGGPVQSNIEARAINVKKISDIDIDN